MAIILGWADHLRLPPEHAAEYVRLDGEWQAANEAVSRGVDRRDRVFERLKMRGRFVGLFSHLMDIDENGDVVGMM